MVEPEFNLKFEYIKKISRKKIANIWMTFKPTKLMPTISAYVVHHKEFKKISRDYDEYLVEHGADPKAGGQWEYGESIPKQITAFVIFSKPNEHFIFIDT